MRTMGNAADTVGEYSVFFSFIASVLFLFLHRYATSIIDSSAKTYPFITVVFSTIRYNHKKQVKIKMSVNI